MGKKISIAIFFALFMVTPLFGMPLKVTIKNATTGTVLKNYPFSVEIRKSKSGDLLKRIELKTDDNGIYTGNIPIDGQSTLYGLVSYRGVTYSAIADKGGQLSINVYEITDRSNVIKIPHRTMIISPQDERTVQVFEVLIIKNSGNETFVGRFNDELDTHQVLFIPMPRGYRLNHLQGITSQKVFTYNKGIVTQEEIPPGERELVLGYILRSDTGLFDLSVFSIENSFVPENVTVLFQEKDGWRFEPSHLKSSGKSKFYGKIYRTWTGNNEKSLKLRLYGPSYQSSLSIWGIAIVSGILISTIFLILYRKKLRIYYLKREKDRILETLSALKTVTEGDGFYDPMIRLLEERVVEINRRLET
jgi:hypothetical protein